MAAAVAVARYLLSEASSGTSPTTTADDTGNGNTLTVGYSSSDAEWTSVAAGNGVDFLTAADTPSTARLYLEDIVNNGNLGSALDDAKEVWMVLAFDNIVGTSSGMRAFAIGTNSGNTDLSLIKNENDLWQARWDRESGGDVSGFVFDEAQSASGTVDVIVIQFDTNQAAAADGQKAWFNDSLVSQSSVLYTQNSILDAINQTDRWITVGNRPDRARNVQGQIYTAIIGTGVLTSQQVTDISTNLLTDNDADPLAPAVTSASTGTMVPTSTETNIVDSGRTLIQTLTGDTYAAAGTGPIGSTADSQAFIDGIVSAQSEANGWNAERSNISTTDLVRTSDTVATLTLPALGSYAITATETLEHTIPAAVLVTSTSAIVATPTFTITPDAAGFKPQWARNSNVLIQGGLS